MNLLLTLYNEVLYRPLLNILFLFYHYIPDMGVAIILLTLLIRLVFYPLGVKALNSQKQMAELQPKIKEIQEKHKHDKEAQTKALMEFYQSNNINLFSGCLPLLVQFPFLIALYQLFLRGINADALTKLYSFVPHVNQLNVTLLGIVNLGQPNVVLAIMAGITQFFQFKTIPQQPKTKGQSDISQALGQQMAYIFPVLMLIICLKAPSAVALYLIVTNIFSIVQQLIIYRKKTKTN